MEPTTNQEGCDDDDKDSNKNDDDRKPSSSFRCCSLVLNDNDNDNSDQGCGGGGGSGSATTTTAALPLFYYDLHSHYIRNAVKQMGSIDSYEGAHTEHLRLSGLYWSLTALSMLHPEIEVDEMMGVTVTSCLVAQNNREETLLDFVFNCYDERSGGFAGNVGGQDGHVLYTLSALQILALFDRLNDDERLQRDRVVNFIRQLQQPDGSFVGDSNCSDAAGVVACGEVDTRFSYCALQALALLGAMDSVDVDKAVDYVLKCRNSIDGGFGCVIGAESHAGQVFCCVGALAIAQKMDELSSRDWNLLSWWLSERQCDSGGLNGRPEKQADVCYSWWILSSLSILGTVDYISQPKLAAFILNCQDPDNGGIADRPDDQPDVFHTFFGIAGLSLLGYLRNNNAAATTTDEPAPKFREIDPIYALPTDVVKRLKLPGQVIRRRTKKSSNDDDDDYGPDLSSSSSSSLLERLSHYSVLHR